MLKIQLLAGLLMVSFMAAAQTTEGMVVYERKINMHRRIQDEQMKAMIPEFRTTRHQLLFVDSASIYKAVPEEDAQETFSTESGGSRMFMRMGGTDNTELFRDFSQSRSVEAREMGARNFLIEDTIRPRAWKLTGETKVILGYTCRKAVSTETMMAGGGMRIIRDGGAQQAGDSASRPTPREVVVEAWYAETINAPVGPDTYGLLPGVILELNIDNGFMVYQAVEVKNQVARKDVKEPKKGKKITRAAFMEMQREMFRGGGGGGGGMQIIRM